MTKKIEFSKEEWESIKQWSMMLEKEPEMAIKGVLHWAMAPYKADKEQPQKGLYKPNVLWGESTAEKPCWILGKDTMCGAPYMRIVAEGRLMKVPEDCVREIEEEA